MKIFNFSFQIETTRLCICWVFEELSCSIGWQVMPFSQYGQGYFLPDLIFHWNLGFRTIILDPEMLKSRSRALMTYRLVSNKTSSQKIGSLVWYLGPDDLSQNAWMYPHYDVTHKKTKFLTFPIYKKYELQDFPFFRGLEKLSYSIGWRIIVVQSSAKKWCTWN